MYQWLHCHLLWLLLFFFPQIEIARYLNITVRRFSLAAICCKLSLCFRPFSP